MRHALDLECTVRLLRPHGARGLCQRGFCCLEFRLSSLTSGSNTRSCDLRGAPLATAPASSWSLSRGGGGGSLRLRRGCARRRNWRSHVLSNGHVALSHFLYCYRDRWNRCRAWSRNKTGPDRALSLGGSG